MKKLISIIIMTAAVAAAAVSCNSDKYVASVTELQLASISPGMSYSGQIVKVLGRNFSEEFGENTVTVGGKDAKVLEYSAWDLVIVLPDHEPGKYEVVVTTPRGTVGGIYIDYIEKPEHLYIVSTYAGSTRGTEDGAGTSAKFDVPEGLVPGPDGNLYVLQRGNTFAVRKIDKYRNVTTFATSSLLSHPWQGAFGPDGNLYFANKSNSKLLKADAGGVITEVSVSGAELNNPMGCKFDKDGNMYLANRNAAQVLKIKDGVVVATYNDLKMASCVAIDKDSRVLVGSESEGHIFMIGKDGEVSAVAGCGKLSTSGNPDGPASEAVIGIVAGIWAASDGSIYFTDRTAQSVRKLTPDDSGDYSKGKVVTLVDGFYPSDIVVSEDCSKIYVSSATGHQIKLIERQ